ncbi:MAG: thioredoxin-disulfide reductase [Clostridia bacterium]|nr:thioredoxin-disulfide reductase [Clostridia bacterium]
MSAEHIYDTVIIGGGPAGYTAALYAVRSGLDTLVIEKMSVGGQMSTTDVIDNYPGFPEGIDGFELGMRMQQGAERFGAKTEYAEIISVSLSEKIKSVCSDSQTYRAKTVIISTGAAPRELGVPRERELVGRGIHYCAHCDGRFYKDKTVIVVGGGNSAVSDALYLSKLAKKVYLVHRRDTLRATKLYNRALSNAANISFLWNSEVTELMTEGRVNGAVIKNNLSGELSRVMCDGIFVSIGRKPETELFYGHLTLDSYGYIPVDETTKTEIPGVYAVGDVRAKPLRQVVTAVADGAVAAHFADEYISENFSE